MPNILRRLRINEISSVDRGAGEGCRIVLYKRDKRADKPDFWDVPLPPPPRPLLFNDVMLRKLADEPRDDDDPRRTNTIDDDKKLSGKLKEFVAVMVRAAPTLSEEEALFFLLHHPTGRKLAEHLNSISKAERQPPMNRLEELKDFAKANGGMEMICKNIIDRGRTTISEQEFSAALMEHAKGRRKADESVVKAFSRMIEEDSDIRRALGICKGYPNLMSLEPLMVGGNDAFDTSVVDSSAKAAEQLKSLVEAQRSRAPTLTTSQLCERVYSDPANAKIVAAAHRRPTASSTSGDELQRR